MKRLIGKISLTVAKQENHIEVFDINPNLEVFKFETLKFTFRMPVLEGKNENISRVSLEKSVAKYYQIYIVKIEPFFEKPEFECIKLKFKVCRSLIGKPYIINISGNLFNYFNWGYFHFSGLKFVYNNRTSTQEQKTSIS